MENITYTSLRKNLSFVLDKVEADHIPVQITRKNHKNIVLITEDDYSSLNETLYIMSSHENVKRLRKSRQEATNGEIFELNLDAY